MADCIEAHGENLKREVKRREAEAKDQVYMLYVQALQIGNVVANIIPGSKATLQPLSYYYPDLADDGEERGQEGKSEDFTETKAGDRPKVALDLEMEKYKADMDDFIFRHNRAFAAQKRGENSGRNDAGTAASDHRGPDEGLL